MSLWMQLREVMLQHPERQISEGNTSLTYEEMVVWAELFATRLKGQQCCAILCSSELESAMALLGCLAAEVTAVPLSFKYGKQHYTKILRKIQPTALIISGDRQLNIISFTDSTYQAPEEHPALIMCTSGTTGEPKGAMLSEHNIRTNVEDVISYMKTDENDRILIARPLYHCAVLTGEFLTSLFKGSDICFYSEPFHPLKLMETIREKKITVFGATPTILSVLARLAIKKGMPTLAHICVSGEIMTTAVAKKISEAFPQADIYHVYGLTEASPRVAYLPPHLFAEHPTSVGIPLPSVTVKIVTEDGGCAKYGQVGILWVRGDNVMMGYYQDPEQSARVLRDGWLCTGDMAVMDEMGLISIKGRVDDLIIRAGMNIYPSEIENALRSDERVREVFAYGYEDDHGVTQIGIKIAGDFQSKEQVKRCCLEHLPPYAIPTRITLLDELPKNGSGKILRRV